MIDDLVTKLQELTTPKPKYEVGQVLWFIQAGLCVGEPSFTIASEECYAVKHMDGTIDYEIGEGFQCQENEVFHSKESLIEAQIAYWMGLKNKEISTRSDDVSMTPAFEGEIQGFNTTEPCYTMCRMEEYQDHSEDKLEKVCEHEYSTAHMCDSAQCFCTAQCKKCGEFYR